MTNLKDSLKNRLSGNALYWLSQMVLKTCKFQITHQERIEAVIAQERSVIFTGWHGITMMAVPLIQKHYHEMSDFVVLMPDDWRGVALRIWAGRLGSTPYPMKLTGDSTLGMARQLVRLTRRLMGGKNLYINPDGPAGPSHVIKPGITYLARKANAIILPIGAYTRRAYIVPRWDRYALPFPFSRIAFHIGPAIESLPEDATAATCLVTNELNRVTIQAAADYYEYPKN